MAAQTPEQLHTLFTARFNAGDLNGLLELYEDHAVILTMNGKREGKTAIGEEIAGLLAIKLPISMTTIVVTAAADIALLSASWVIDGVGTGKTAEVARRGSDGVWRFIVDHPWGI